MNNLKSDFTYNLRTVKGHPFIMIEDKNLGNKSVTNEIELIIEEICILHKLNPVEHNIIYKDSDGYWDGYEFSTNNFLNLHQTNWLQAAIKLLNI